MQIGANLVSNPADEIPPPPQVRDIAGQAREARAREPRQRGELSAELVEVDLQDQRKDGLRRPVRRAGEADVGGHRQSQAA